MIEIIRFQPRVWKNQNIYWQAVQFFSFFFLPLSAWNTYLITTILGTKQGDLPVVKGRQRMYSLICCSHIKKKLNLHLKNFENIRENVKIYDLAFLFNIHNAFLCMTDKIEQAGYE